MRENLNVVRVLNRLPTLALIALKMSYTKEISLYRILKLFFTGVIGICGSELVKVLFEQKAMNDMHWLAVFVVISCMLLVFAFHHLGAEETAKKELVDDLLSTRKDGVS